MSEQRGNILVFSAVDNGTDIKITSPTPFTTMTFNVHGTAAGQFTFTVDGDAGAGENIVDLSTNIRTLVSNASLHFVNVSVRDIPVGSVITLYLS